MDHKYKLTMNEKIVLLAQMNHVGEVMGKNIRQYHQLVKLMDQIVNEIRFPDDLPWYFPCYL